MFAKAVVALECARMSDGRDVGNVVETVENIFTSIAFDIEVHDGSIFLDFFSRPSITETLQRCSSMHEAAGCLKNSINRHIGWLHENSMDGIMPVDNDRRDNQVFDLLAVRDAAVDYLKTMQP